MNSMLAGILPQEGGLEAAGSGKYNIAIGLLALLTAVGVAAGIHSLWVGHEHTFGVSREVPWGVLIAAYVFFVVTSTGLCIVSSVGHVFGFENFNPIAKRAVFMSIGTIVDWYCGSFKPGCGFWPAERSGVLAWTLYADLLHHLRRDVRLCCDHLFHLYSL